MIVHNGATFIEEAITSVLDQTFKDFEFLILNDGSTDHTQDIIDRFVKTDKRIRAIKNDKNKGLSFSRNTIMRMARGKYIATTDADDISISTRFETQYNYLENNSSIDILGSAVKLINDKGEAFESWLYPETDKEIKEGLNNSCIVANPSSLFRKEVFERTGGYNEALTICEDWDFFVRAAKDFSFANTKEAMILYRVHNNNISKNKLEHTIIYSTYLNHKLNASHMGSGILQTVKDFPDLKNELAQKTIQFYTFWMDTYSKLGYKKLSEELCDFVMSSYFTIFNKELKKQFLKQSLAIFMRRKHFSKSITILTRIIF